MMPSNSSASPAPGLTAIIPAFNEAPGIRDVLVELKAECGDLLHEIIVVDDGSTDETAAIVLEIGGCRLIRQPRNRGYGAALAAGILASRTPWVVTLDADGQHRPADIRRLWAEAVGADGEAAQDMVIGARRGIFHTNAWRVPGKWLLWALASYLVGQRIPDLNSGLRLARRDHLLSYLHLCPSGFSFSTTITMAFLSRQLRTAFVPIDVRRRTGTSTVRIKTGLDTLILILRIATLFNPLRFFLPLSFAAAFAGVVWGLPIVLAREGVSVGAMLAIVTGTLLFCLGLLSDQISQMRLERLELPVDQLIAQRTQGGSEPDAPHPPPQDDVHREQRRPGELS